MFEQIPTAEMVAAVKVKKEFWKAETDTCVARAYPFAPSVAPLAPGMERR